MIREQFERSREDLCDEVLNTIRRHFDHLDLDFDMDAFMAQNGSFLDHMVSDAHFVGAEVFPVDIPLKSNNH